MNEQGLEGVGDEGEGLEELGANLQSLEVVTDIDEGLEELGENLQSLKVVGDGDEGLEEHGKGLEGLEEKREARRLAIKQRAADKNAADRTKARDNSAGGIISGGISVIDMVTSLTATKGLMLLGKSMLALLATPILLPMLTGIAGSLLFYWWNKKNLFK